MILTPTLLLKTSLGKLIGVQFLEKLLTTKSEIMNWSIKVYIIYKVSFNVILNVIQFVLGSDDEKRDLKKGYLAGKGDMEFIINMVPFSSVYEEDRLREILGKIIEEEDLPRFKAFSNEPPSKKRKRLAKVSQLLYWKLLFLVWCIFFNFRLKEKKPNAQ